MKKIVLILLLIFSTVVVGQEEDKKTSLDEPTVVDDGDKTSGRINDIINSVETALKIKDLVNSVKEGKKVVDELKKFKNLKNVKGTISKKLKEAVTQYKSCKWSLFTWVSHVSTKMADVMAKCNDRVNMWRTTEPMLINYYKSMGKLSNNTLEVFKDFEISDAIDIDRKWSRKMDAQLLQDKRFAYSFFAFAAQHFPDGYYEKKYSSLFINYGLEKELTKTTENLEAYLEIKDNVCDFNQIPFQTLLFASGAILDIREVANKSHGASVEDPSVSEEQHSMEIIENSLNAGNGTYNDIMDNGEMIQAKRAEVSIQRTQLQQMYSELQTRYTRLLLRKQERFGIQYEAVDSTLNRLVNGGNFETIDQARLRRFGESAGL